MNSIPFNPSTRISCFLTEVADVRLEVFNAVGQHVVSIVDGRQHAGAHNVNFQAGRQALLLFFGIGFGEKWIFDNDVSCAGEGMTGIAAGYRNTGL